MKNSAKYIGGIAHVKVRPSNTRTQPPLAANWHHWHLLMIPFPLPLPRKTHPKSVAGNFQPSHASYCVFPLS